ncbi:MurJ-like flippase [Rubripirellula obstinata]|uniref:MurJ-like flippase n=1 Tax=Rubripirellula obstinata TaxID=406547 RepID=A0A5B1CEC9_9BACT|nr:lipopolysaccharide biosynthesis protein [Rubripirellula obstinata]KAA1259508.1 MurJ-like flippase [Rubripirellula obstinata]
MTQPAPESKQDVRSFAADSLAIGMAVMLAMTIIQRGMGFFRGIWFCRMLDDAVVGQWSMAYDFITMMTPVMLLGLPGSLPRYVEHYRIRGHLPQFVRRLLIATGILGAICFAGIMIAPDWFGWLVFLEPQNAALVYSVGVGVVAIVVFNFIYQLVSSLRQVRVASMMQFVQSIAFTVIAVIWLGVGGGLVGLVYGFIAATILSMVPGLISLASGWKGLPISEEPFAPPAMWQRLLPYAAAIWAMNLLTNTFTLSDRYMILHMMPGSEEVTQAAVGQYHSGRIIPMLLVSLATMVSGVLMPYLTADWEAGKTQEVREKLRRILFAMSAFFTAGAAVSLLLAPWFFENALQDRYSAGLAMMPMTFVFCIWISLGNIGQDYLWVAEKGKWVAVAIGVGFALNIAMNYALLPIWGLHGAVVATLVSNGVVLLGLWVAMNRFGYPLDQSTIVATLLPATLLMGPWVTLVCVAMVCAGTGQTRSWCGEAIDHAKAKFASQRKIAV